jgi:hypothetical protein
VNAPAQGPGQATHFVVGTNLMLLRSSVRYMDVGCHAKGILGLTCRDLVNKSLTPSSPGQPGLNLAKQEVTIPRHPICPGAHTREPAGNGRAPTECASWCIPHFPFDVSVWLTRTAYTRHRGVAFYLMKPKLALEAVRVTVHPSQISSHPYTVATWFPHQYAMFEHSTRL